MLKTTFLVIVISLFSKIALSACPTPQTKFSVYTNLPAPPIVATAASQGTWQRYASLNKKIISDKSFAMIDFDDIAFPVPTENVKSTKLTYLMEWDHEYQFPIEIDYGNGNVETHWQTVKTIYPKSYLAMSDDAPEGVLANYKTQILNIDIVGKGCPSVLFTTDKLISAPMLWNANFGNFILGFNEFGQAQKIIELDARLGENASLGLGSSDSTIELKDIDGDGKLDFVVKRNGVVAYVFQGYGSGAYQDFQISPYTRKSQDSLALRQVWKDFIALAAAQDSRATLYFSTHLIGKNSALASNSQALPLFSQGIVDSDVVKITPDIATFGVVYTSPIGNVLDLIDFVRENGAWKINDF